MTKTMIDELEVKEICSTSTDSDSENDDEESHSFSKGRKMESEKTVRLDDGDNGEKHKTRKRIRTKRELRAHRLAKREKDRMAMVLPDPVRDRERERDLVRLATRGVVQLFNAVAERQNKLKSSLAANKLSKKRRMRGISPESFKRKLAEEEIIKDETVDTKDDWLSEDRIKRESEEEGNLDSSEIKTEPETDSE